MSERGQKSLPPGSATQEVKNHVYQPSAKPATRDQGYDRNSEQYINSVLHRSTLLLQAGHPQGDVDSHARREREEEKRRRREQKCCQFRENTKSEDSRSSFSSPDRSANRKSRLISQAACLQPEDLPVEHPTLKRTSRFEREMLRSKYSRHLLQTTPHAEMTLADLHQKRAAMQAHQIELHIPPNGLPGQPRPVPAPPANQAYRSSGISPESFRHQRRSASISSVFKKHRRSSSITSMTRSVGEYLNTSAEIIDNTRREFTACLRRSIGKFNLSLSQRSAIIDDDNDDCDSDSELSFCCVGEKPPTKTLYQLERDRRLSLPRVEPFSNQDRGLCRRCGKIQFRGLCRSCDEELRNMRYATMILRSWKNVDVVVDDNALKPPPPLKIVKQRLSRKSAISHPDTSLLTPSMTLPMKELPPLPSSRSGRGIANPQKLSDQSFKYAHGPASQDDVSPVSSWGRWESAELRAEYDLAQELGIDWESIGREPRNTAGQSYHQASPLLMSRFNSRRYHS